MSQNQVFKRAQENKLTFELHFLGTKIREGIILKLSGMQGYFV